MTVLSLLLDLSHLGKESCLKIKRWCSVIGIFKVRDIYVKVESQTQHSAQVQCRSVGWEVIVGVLRIDELYNDGERR